VSSCTHELGDKLKGERTARPAAFAIWLRVLKTFAIVSGGGGNIVLIQRTTSVRPAVNAALALESVVIVCCVYF
jgi:hypothetical protein